MAAEDDSVPTTFNLLFVCTGNTCRSPIAAALAVEALRERGWSHVAVRSAGTAAGAGGQPAPAAAVAVGREAGLDLSAHRSAALTPELVEWADLVLAMSPGHLWSVAELGGAGRVALITEFADDHADGDAVPDPFGGDEAAYRATLIRLQRLIDGVLRRLEPILAP